MPILNAKVRKEKAKNTRKKGKIPAILYGPGIENLKLEIEEKDFENILKESGEGTHITLKVRKKDFSVLIKEIQRDFLTGKILHVDLFQPSAKEKIEVSVPIVFEGKAPAVKMGGVLVKNLSEIELKGFWKDLPKEVRVDVSKLKTFEDKILVSDLKLPKGVEVLRKKDEILAFVAPPEREIEEEKEIKEEAEEKVEKETLKEQTKEK
jgi:large subunit ribosomal protein L25